MGFTGFSVLHGKQAHLVKQLTHAGGEWIKHHLHFLDQEVDVGVSLWGTQVPTTVLLLWLTQPSHSYNKIFETTVEQPLPGVGVFLLCDLV